MVQKSPEEKEIMENSEKELFMDDQPWDENQDVFNPARAIDFLQKRKTGTIRILKRHGNIRLLRKKDRPSGAGMGSIRLLGKRHEPSGRIRLI